MQTTADPLEGVPLTPKTFFFFFLRRTLSSRASFSFFVAAFTYYTAVRSFVFALFFFIAKKVSNERESNSLLCHTQSNTRSHSAHLTGWPTNTLCRGCQVFYLGTDLSTVPYCKVPQGYHLLAGSHLANPKKTSPMVPALYFWLLQLHISSFNSSTALFCFFLHICTCNMLEFLLYLYIFQREENTYVTSGIPTRYFTNRKSSLSSLTLPYTLATHKLLLLVGGLLKGFPVTTKTLFPSLSPQRRV